MSNHHLNAAIDKFQSLLRKLDPSFRRLFRSTYYDSLTKEGDVRGGLIFLHHLLLEFSPLIASVFQSQGLQASSSDAAFVSKAWRALSNITTPPFRPDLSPTMFLTPSSFIAPRLNVLSDIANIVLSKHQELSHRSKSKSVAPVVRGSSNRETRTAAPCFPAIQTTQQTKMMDGKEVDEGENALHHSHAQEARAAAAATTVDEEDVRRKKMMKKVDQNGEDDLHAQQQQQQQQPERKQERKKDRLHSSGRHHAHGEEGAAGGRNKTECTCKEEVETLKAKMLLLENRLKMMEANVMRQQNGGDTSSTVLLPSSN